MRIRRLAKAALLVWASSLAAPARAVDRQGDSDRSELPRYSFKVGQELSYQAHSEFQGPNGPPLKSQYNWQVWVVKHNDDDSWRLILRQSYSYDMPAPAAEGKQATPGGAAKPAGSARADRRAKPAEEPGRGEPPGFTAPEYVTFAYCDLFADGRITDNPTIDLRLEPRLLFPQLPRASKDLQNGWSDSRRGTQVTYRYRASPPPEDDDEPQVWQIRATRQSPIDDVLLSSTKATYFFNAERGVIERVESQLHQEYGLNGEGTNTTELMGTESFDQAWTRTLEKEMQIYFDVQQRYRELLQEAQRDSTETETLLLDAGALLQQAAGKVTLPLIKEELNKQLAQHAMNAGFAARAARDRADLIDAPAPNWQLKDLDGKSHSLRNYKGKVVVLEFWQRGSDWCLRLVPQVEQIAEHFEDQPVVVLGMNIDAKEDDARFVAERMALNYPTLRADKIAEKYGVRELPAVVVIDQKGNIRDYLGGYSTTLAKEVIAEVEDLLGKGKQDEKE